jgi:hypothetical protein
MGGLIVKVFTSIPKVKVSNLIVVLCAVNNGMLTKYSLIEFLEYVLKLITWLT